MHVDGDFSFSIATIAYNSISRNEISSIFLCHSSNFRTDIAQGTKDLAVASAQGTKDLAVASAGVNSYGVNVDGAVKGGDIVQGTKDLAVASAGLNSYGVNVDGAVKSPISNAVEVIDEAAEAGRGINSYGTNVDHRLGHELEAH